jgi:hypothetical protein
VGPDSNDKSLDVNCDGTRKLLGGGARIVGLAAGTAADITIWENYAFDDDTWRASAAEDANVAGNWSLEVTIICANITT